MISFLLPTTRINSHREVFNQAVMSIRNHHTKGDYEILVYSTDPVEGEDIRFFQEEEKAGPIKGFNYLLQHAKGDYISVCVDDHQYISSCYPMIEEMESDDSKYKIRGTSPDGGTIVTPRRNDRLGTTDIEFDVPVIPMIRFPFFRKDCLDLLNGHIFHPSLYYHAGDIYLSYFLHTMGHRNIEGPTRIVTIEQLKDSTYECQDCDMVHELMKNFDINKGYLQ